LLTETWTHSYSQLSYNGFEYFVLNRTELLKSSKRYSGGIVVYVRNNYVSNDTLIFKCHDDIVCLKISGSKRCLKDDLYICLCYVVPEGSSRNSMIESHTFDRLSEYICNLDL